MDYDSFLHEWLGKQVTAYGGECVALVAQYCAENGKPIVWGNAIDWADNPIMLGAFDWIVNDPNDPNQLPSRGDIIIWNGSLPGSGGYGHIAIWDEVYAPHIFQSFDQNWGGAEAHFEQHTWAYVLGWYHLKAAAPVLPAPHPDPAPANPAPPPPPPAPAPSPPPVTVNDPLPPAPAPAPQPPVNPPNPDPVVETPPTPPGPVIPPPVPGPPSWLARLFRAILNFIKGK